MESVHKEEGSEECQISTQEFIEDSRARRTLQKSKNELNLKCNQCEWTTTSKTLLNRHIKADHSSQTNTDESPVKATTNSLIIEEKEKELVKVKETKVKKKPYVQKRLKCEYCDKKFNKKERYEKHKESVHIEKSQQVISGIEDSDLPGQAQDQIVNNVNIPSQVMTLLDNRRVLRNKKNRGNL